MKKLSQVQSERRVEERADQDVRTPNEFSGRRAGARLVAEHGIAKGSDVRTPHSDGNTRGAEFISAQVISDALEPRCSYGDLVIADPYRPVENGDLALVRLSNGLEYCRTYKQLEDGFLELTPINPQLAKEKLFCEEVEWIHPVSQVHGLLGGSRLPKNTRLTELLPPKLMARLDRECAIHNRCPFETVEVALKEFIERGGMREA